MFYNEVIKVWRESGETNLSNKFITDFTYNSIKLTEEQISPKKLILNYKTRTKSLKDILEQK